jgi:hypothetical protein
MSFAIALVKALLLSRKKTWSIAKNQSFWLPQQKMSSMAGTFTIPEFNSSYSITDSNLVRIGDKKFLEKNHVLPPSI